MRVTVGVAGSDAFGAQNNELNEEEGHTTYGNNSMQIRSTLLQPLTSVGSLMCNKIRSFRVETPDRINKGCRIKALLT